MREAPSRTRGGSDPKPGRWVGFRVDVSANFKLTDFDHDTPAIQHLVQKVSPSLAGALRGALVRKELDSLDLHLLGERMSDSRLHEFFAAFVSSEEQARALIERLGKERVVKAAWLKGRLRPASNVVIGADSFADKEQVELRDAPAGVGARWAFAQTVRGHFADGNGLRFGDVEAGWNDHDDFGQDLPAPVVPAAAGQGSAEDRLHGEMALGLIIANAPGGCVGIAPKARCVALGSCFDPHTGSMVFLAEALAAVGAEGAKLVLIEMDRTLNGVRLPVEVDPADRHAIQELVAAGIHVVEPAGNGGVDLTYVEDVDGRTSLSRYGAEAVDSGAILVGAVNDVNGLSVGNYGPRVDCHAWGRMVRTTGTLADPDKGYGSFGGTSAASAVVAGVCLNLLGAATAAGLQLRPPELRAALRDLRNGTREPSPENQPLGPMPDLRRLLRRVQGQDLVGGPVLEHDSKTVPRMAVSPALRIEGGQLSVRVATSDGMPSAKQVSLHLAVFQPNTLPDPGGDLSLLPAPVDAGLLAANTNVASTPFALPAGWTSAGIVARAVVDGDWDQGWDTWTAEELMSASRSDPRLALRNVHPFTQGADHAFTVGGADPAEVQVFTDAADASVTQGSVTVSLVNGDRIKLQQGAATLNAGATGTRVTLLHLREGRTVGALHYRS